MDFAAFLGIAVPVVYVLVGVALIWLVVEIVKFLRSTTKTVDNLKSEVEPTLAHVEQITAALEPVVAKVDPLVERVSLTVDAANLEIMRVDQILENVTDITESVSSATVAVDTAANAPVKLVETASEKIRGVFKSRKASDESQLLGENKARAAVADTQKPAIAAAAEKPEPDAEAFDFGVVEFGEVAVDVPAVEEAAKAVADAAEGIVVEEGPSVKDVYVTYTPIEPAEKQ